MSFLGKKSRGQFLEEIVSYAKDGELQIAASKSWQHRYAFTILLFLRYFVKIWLHNLAEKQRSHS